MPPISQPILTASRLMVGTIEFGTTWRQNTMPSGMPRARAAVELVGQPVRLLDWQNMEILRIYDNPAITRKCFWTFGKVRQFAWIRREAGHHRPDDVD